MSLYNLNLLGWPQFKQNLAQIIVKLNKQSTVFVMAVFGSINDNKLIVLNTGWNVSLKFTN